MLTSRGFCENEMKAVVPTFLYRVIQFTVSDILFHWVVQSHTGYFVAQARVELRTPDSSAR